MQEILAQAKFTLSVMGDLVQEKLAILLSAAEKVIVMGEYLIICMAVIVRGKKG